MGAGGRRALYILPPDRSDNLGRNLGLEVPWRCGVFWDRRRYPDPVRSGPGQEPVSLEFPNALSATTGKVAERRGKRTTRYADEVGTMRLPAVARALGVATGMAEGCATPPWRIAGGIRLRR